MRGSSRCPMTSTTPTPKSSASSMASQTILLDTHVWLWLIQSLGVCHARSDKLAFAGGCRDVPGPERYRFAGHEDRGTSPRGQERSEPDRLTGAQPGPSSSPAD